MSVLPSQQLVPFLLSTRGKGSTLSAGTQGPYSRNKAVWAAIYLSRYTDWLSTQKLFVVFHPLVD